MNPYKVYSKNSCIYCVKAKNFLNAKGISYDEIQLDTDDLRLEFKQEFPNLKTVPQIFKYNVETENYSHIGGYEELIEHFRVISEDAQ